MDEKRYSKLENKIELSKTDTQVNAYIGTSVNYLKISSKNIIGKQQNIGKSYMHSKRNLWKCDIIHVILNIGRSASYSLN